MTTLSRAVILPLLEHEKSAVTKWRDKKKAYSWAEAEKKVKGNAGRRKYNDEYIDPLDNRRLNLNNDTLFILSLPFMFQDKEIFTWMWG